MPVPAQITATATTLSFASAAAALAASAFYVRRYADRRERAPGVLAVAVVGLAIALTAAACALPADVFLVSSSSNAKTGFKQPWADPPTLESIRNSVNWIYDSLFLVLALYAFLVVPFAYFYFEEEDETRTAQQRFNAAVRMTLATAVILIILMLVGLILKPNDLSLGGPIDFDFLKKALLGGSLESALLFILAMFMVLGMLVFLVYTAPGVFLLPIYLLKPLKSLETDILAVTAELNDTRARLQDLHARQPNPSLMTSREHQRLEDLEEQERKCLRKLDRIQAGDRPMCCGPLWKIASFPLKVACFVYSGAVIVAIISTIQSNPPLCAKCPRLVLPVASAINPVDASLAFLARFYPVDHILFASVLVYLLAATLHGVKVVGVRVLWIRLFRLRKGRTAPQALLLVTVVVIMTLLALLWEMTAVVAPQYATWGSQVYCAATPDKCANDAYFRKPCDLSAPAAACTPTVLSVLLARVGLTAPFVATAFYYTQIVAVAVSGLALLYGLVSARKSRAADVGDSDSDSEFDDEVEDGERARPAPPATVRRGERRPLLRSDSN
ncbi:hypothetical protein AMAG_02347 [Allomyces macrogynus ATCC 38327]|uniref:Probable lysosomal cobalamin transporter n=1 Tax=Allomyces macrogynus (strain ATCC 38327) TaxID=578462 RepID=A0A0L0S2C7_ALLM3|nr:hypothetical protein AMAG_02347 [Allomyces macrogynus ATCC 38327]|eukprot:KNE56546.1 hypothetical protein AMAG_02347 [Allomyces macrogynus ATCC 38327]